MRQPILSGILLCFTAAASNAALVGRDLNSSPGSTEAYYDTVLNITWLANANLADTNDFGVTGILSNGRMTWATANEWIAAMNAANNLGVNTWRLPTVNPVNGSSFNYDASYDGSTDRGYNQSEQGSAYAGSTGSELAHLFYNTLDNKGYCTPTSIYPDCTEQSGWGLSNTGPFSNLRRDVYWSGTSYAPAPDVLAWIFFPNTGFQTFLSKGDHNFALAVSPGDVGNPVPIPPAVYLFGSALGVMGWMRRKAA